MACTGARVCGGPGAPTRPRARGDVQVIEPPQLEPDYELLFDGTSKAGWTQAGPASSGVEDGSLVSYGGLGLLWYSTGSSATSR